jgi:curved DNA-binding protein
MNDLYQTLGVDASATQDEIKSAYRKLAMKHHPDRMGGDDSKFKEIQNAYGTLSDAQKKAEYDQMRMGGPQVRFHTGNGGFDPFEHMFGGGGGNPFGDIFGQRRVHKNRDLNIQCQVTLIDSFNGKQLEASYQLPSGRMQTVVINVPAGIEHGATIKYAGLGDDSHPSLQRGDLNVTILVMPDRNYRREGNDVISTLEITPIEAMIGCKKHITTLSGQQLVVDVRSGAETGAEYAVNGHGFNVVNSNMRGRHVAQIKIKSTEVLDPAIVEKLKIIDHEISRQR